MFGAIEITMCAMALLFSSVRLGAGRPIIQAAVLVMHVNFAQLVMDDMLKKQVKIMQKKEFVNLRTVVTPYVV